jgi:hypothetical protein
MEKQIWVKFYIFNLRLHFDMSCYFENSWQFSEFTYKVFLFLNFNKNWAVLSLMAKMFDIWKLKNQYYYLQKEV